MSWGFEDMFKQIRSILIGGMVRVGDCKLRVHTFESLLTGFSGFSDFSASTLQIPFEMVQSQETFELFFGLVLKSRTCQDCQGNKIKGITKE